MSDKATKYQITITKIESKTETREGDFTVIDERPWNHEELEEEMSSRYGDPNNFLEKNPLKRIHGYAPPVQCVKEEETQILKQTVETLDIAAVIKAVNGL